MGPNARRRDPLHVYEALSLRLFRSLPELLLQPAEPNYTVGTDR